MKKSLCTYSPYCLYLGIILLVFNVQMFLCNNIKYRMYYFYLQSFLRTFNIFKASKVLIKDSSFTFKNSWKLQGYHHVDAFEYELINPLFLILFYGAIALPAMPAWWTEKRLTLQSIKAPCKKVLNRVEHHRRWTGTSDYHSDY